MNGLVIKSPWMERILSTPKTWLLRGSKTSTRGTIALIKSRSGQVLGTCTLEDCIGPLTLEQYQQNAALHGTPADQQSELPHARTYAWIVSDVKTFAEPIPYKHPTGSVVWVKLNPQNVPERYDELEPSAMAQPQPPTVEMTITPVVAQLEAPPQPAAPAPQEPETQVA